MKSTSNLPEELYYLDERFSVRSLKKYQLKDILTAHNVPCTNSMRKLEMINLFKDQIESKRVQIIDEYNKRHVTELPEDDAEELGRGHRNAHKKPTKSKDEEVVKDNDGFAVPALPKKRGVPRFSAQDSFDEGDESEHYAEPKVSKHKAIPTVFKETPASDKPTKIKKPIRHEATFNPEDSFASSDDEQAVERKNKPRVPRKRLPLANGKPVAVEKTTRKQKAKETEMSPLHDDNLEDDDSDYLGDSDDTDEEEDDEEEDGFVDEKEVNSLYREQLMSLDKLVTPEHPMLTRAQSSADAKKKALLWRAKFKNAGYIFGVTYMVIAVMGLLFTTYARKQNGYCESISSDRDVSFIFSLLPSSCIPCPTHGTCVYGELQCDSLYEQKRPFYNVGGFLPIADECIHDSFVGKHVANVEKKIKKHLTTQQAKTICKHLVTHPELSPEDVPILRISVKDVLTEVKASVEPYFTADQVNEIIYVALSGALEDPDVHYWEIDNEKYFGTTRVVLPLSCQLKRLYMNTPITVKLYILLFISVLSAVYGVSKDYQKNKLYKKKIEGYVKSIIDKLSEQYENHTKDPKAFESPTVAVSQIRSSILNVNDRDTITDWHKVVEKVQHHPHVRKSFQEVRGDPVEFWELAP